MKKKGYSSKRIRKIKKEIFGQDGLLSQDTDSMFYFELTKFKRKHADLVEQKYIKRMIQKLAANVENSKYNTHGKVKIRSCQLKRTQLC